jgi:hypothetical protein
MSLPLPSEFHSVLSEQRLGAIATRLLEVRHSTIRELSTDLDDNYVRETAIFGRSRNMLIGMALNVQFPWLRLSHAALDITAEIEGIPFRFFRDDPDNPSKLGFFKRNEYDSLFAREEEAPVMWRFVVERAESEEAEDQVHFVVYNVFNDKFAQWTLRADAVRQLAGVDAEVPAAKEIALPEIELLPEEGNDRQERTSS